MLKTIASKRYDWLKPLRISRGQQQDNGIRPKSQFSKKEILMLIDNFLSYYYF
jgi:hypothetical protein